MEYTPLSPAVPKWICGIFVALSGLFFMAYIIQNAGSALIVAGDFVVFFHAAQASAGHAVEAYTMKPTAPPCPDNGLCPFAYPPYFLFFLRPLAGLPYNVAALCGLGVSWLSYVMVIFYSPFWRRITQDVSRKERMLFSALVMVSPFVVCNLMTAQTGFLMGACLIGGLAWLETRPVLAGVLLGMLAIKPQAALLVPIALMAGGHWRAFFVAGIAVSVLAGASMVIYGHEVWSAYFTQTAVFTEYARDIPLGMRKLTLSMYSTVKLMGAGASWAMGGQILCMVVSTVLVWRVYRARAEPIIAASVLITATLLSAPYVMAYDMLACIIPVLLWLSRPVGRPYEWMAAIMLLATPLLLPQITQQLMPVGGLVLMIAVAVAYLEKRNVIQ